MKERKLSLPRLAIKAEIDKSQLSRIVRFATGYSPDSLQRLADSLEVTIGELFSEVTNRLPSSARMVPLLKLSSVRVFLSGESGDDGLEIQEFAMTCPTCSAKAFAVVVADDAMHPLLEPGDVVIVDPAGTPLPGQIVLAVGESGEPILRRYADRGEMFELLPANTVYGSVRSDQRVLTILGVARQRIVDLQK